MTESSPSVEVESVRPSSPGDRMSSFPISDAGTVVMRNKSTKSLIEFAYDLQDSQLSGWPEWVESERYDIDLKRQELPPPSSDKYHAALQQHRAMVRALLADRFNLKLIRQTKQTPVYVLVTAQGGPKIPQRAVAPDAVVSISVLVEKGKLTMAGGSNSELAKLLAGQLGCEVVDKTGLDGIYDATLQWTPDNQESLLAAVQEQLGMKLEEHIVPVPTYIIDEVEKPSQDSARNN